MKFSGGTWAFKSTILSFVFSPDELELIADGHHITDRGDNMDSLMHTFRAVVRDKVRSKGRKRVMLWSRSREEAAKHGVRRVLWIGGPKGPGYDAHKLGWVSIDRLEEVVRFHVEMMR